MIKTVIRLSLITLIFSLTIISAYADDIQRMNLDSDNILTNDYIELTIDNTPVNCTVVRQNNDLYIDESFFQSYFGLNFKKDSYPVKYGGILKSTSRKEILCLPLFPVLKAMEIRYTYSSLYGKEIVRIRTDNEFKVYEAYSNPPATSQQQMACGNIPYSEPTNNNNSSEDFSTNGYPRVNYAAPVNYGYVYPRDYQPGFYFGTYGFVKQGKAPSNVYTNSCNSNECMVKNVVH